MNPRTKMSPLSLGATLLVAFVALVSFHLAFAVKQTGFLTALYLFCLFSLSRAPSMRVTVYGGFALGSLLYLPHLWFFFGIFGFSAILLLLILVFWLILFLVLARLWVSRVSMLWAVIGLPFLYLGIEYFRSELYPLRFSWLIPGYAFSGQPAFLGLHYIGVYGVGFLLMAISGILHLFPRRFSLPTGMILLITLAIVTNLPIHETVEVPSGPLVVGVQLEHPTTKTVVANLDHALALHPDGELFVLSEYTFAHPVPDEIKQWCRQNHRYLVIGAIDRQSEGDYNTAFVIDPTGEIVFKQAKSVPIQFFNDGLPARTQSLWDSPWGKVGICICYDLSYTRVTDALVKMGAQALIVPTMDLIEWGNWEHLLHRRVALIRAAEYRLPIFRLASSGISQIVRADGFEREFAPFPGQDEIIAAQMPFASPSGGPLDRTIAWIAVAFSGIWLVLAVVFQLSALVKNKRTH